MRRETGNPGDHYSIRKFPGVAQVSYGSLPVALGVATRFASQGAVDVWREEAGRYMHVDFNTAGGRT